MPSKILNLRRGPSSAQAPIPPAHVQLEEARKRALGYQALCDQRDRKRSTQTQRKADEERLERTSCAEQAKEILRDDSNNAEPSRQRGAHTHPPRRTLRTVPLVWDDECPLLHTALCCFQRRRAEDVVEKSVPKVLIREAALNGDVLITDGDGVKRMNHSSVDWHRSSYWRDVASEIVFTKRDGDQTGAIKPSSSSLQPRLIGSGSYNIVFSVAKGALPDEFDHRSAIRITRSDRSEEEGDAHLEMADCVEEVYNTLFCAFNSIGTPLHLAAMFPRMRHSGRELYGSIIIMKAAKCHLGSFLTRCSPYQARDAAISLSNLLFESSVLGVAFFDIKPANILCFEDEKTKGNSFKLTDADSNFFIVTHGRDWRALLLMNLVLLLVHVRNAEYENSDIFIKTLAPLAKQLCSKNDLYDSAWLFQTRAVCIYESEATSPLIDRDFEIQRRLCAIATAYFYGEGVAQRMPSTEFHWEGHTGDWKLHGGSGKNTKSWPSHWQSQRPREDFKPLVDDMVAFACGG